MALTHVTDHEEQALARLVLQYADKTNVRALVGVGGASVQTAEDVLWQLYSQRLLEDAVGAQLDNLGAVVGQAREASTDDQYRARIRGRILANRSSNSTETMIAIAAAVVNDPDLVARVTTYAPAAFELWLDGVSVTDDTADALGDLIRAARAAGIGARVIYSTEPASDTFTCEPVVGFLDAAILSGETELVLQSDADAFPAAGTVKIGEGTATEENVTYSHRLGNVLYLTGSTASAHAENDAVRPSPTTGKGFGDDGDPAEGGVFAGVIAA